MWGRGVDYELRGNREDFIVLIAKLEVWHNETEGGKAVRSFMGFYRSPMGDVWEISPAFPALGAERGYWEIAYQGGGKGSYRTRVVHILDAHRRILAVIPTFEDWSDTTLAMGFGYHFPKHFKVRAAMMVDKKKPFRIRCTGQGGVSGGVVQAEVMYFEIADVNAVESAYYIYQGAGFTLSVPGPKGGGLLKKGVGMVIEKAGKAGVSEFGPWNDFTAPGWLTAFNFEGDADAASPYSVGLSTSTSWTILRFGQEYKVELTNFSGGNTWALPASGFTNGTMKLIKK
jgi:hypothetical protein